jgi:hypothetical protein
LTRIKGCRGWERPARHQPKATVIAIATASAATAQGHTGARAGTDALGASLNIGACSAKARSRED